LPRRLRVSILVGDVERLPRRTLGLLAAAFLMLPACGARPGEERAGRGVIVIVVDALRADHLGAAGYDRATTPYLDGLAKQGALFRRVFSASPEMVPSHAGILTGCDPMLARRIPLGEPSRGTLVSDWFVPDALPRLPRELLARGFTTAAFTDHPAIAPVCGFGAGFQEFRGFLSERPPNASEAGSAAVATKCLNWLTGLDPSQDWFAYLQIDELERLWTRPEESRDTYFEPRPELTAVPPVSLDERAFFAVPRGRWAGGARSLGQYESRYDGGLRALDRDLGRLFENLKRVNRWANTTVVVLGSYGVGFGESGLIVDSGTFSDCDLAVPLIVRPAAGLGGAAGVRVDEITSLIDVAPTLLDLLGMPPPPGMRGVSHAGAIRGQATAPCPVAFAMGGFQGGFAAIDARFCFEESAPASLEQEAASPLSATWYGDHLDHRRDVRRILHDRTTAPGPGHLHGSADLPAESERLAALGREHYEWIERARSLLQRGSGSLAGEDPRTLEELRRRGLLGDESEKP
jgi:arylsulfatase A-like enzyme